MAKKAAAKNKPRVSGDVDKVIGQRLRQLRMQIRMSQSEIADKLGVSFQQIQKYEKGVNRVSAGRLMQMCNLLETNPHDLLGWGMIPSKNANGVNVYDNELFKLAQAFQSLNERMRSPVRSLINSLIAAEADR